MPRPRWTKPVYWGWSQPCHCRWRSQVRFGSAGRSGERSPRPSADIFWRRRHWAVFRISARSSRRSPRPLRFLARPKKEIEAAAKRLLPIIAATIGDGFDVAVEPCASQIGSGALPMETVPSFGIAIRPHAAKRGGRRLAALSIAFRGLPVPVVGRIENQTLIFDVELVSVKPAAAAGSAAPHPEIPPPQPQKK